LSTATAVPESTTERSEGDPRALLKEVGYKQLTKDTITRFRAADGTSHARAFGHAAILTGLPALITLIAIASTFHLGTFRAVMKETLTGLAPGPSGQLMTEAFQQGTNNQGGLALYGGLLAAAIAAIFAMAQIERGCNRIYGIERDRPFGEKLQRAAFLALTSGSLLGAAFIIIAAGGAIGDALRNEFGWGDATGMVLLVARWPLGLALAFVALTLIYRRSPNRQQPGAAWLQTGTILAALLWLAMTAVLALYYANNENMSQTYGPLLGVIALLTWAYASGAALFLGMAFAAQLEAICAGAPQPRTEEQENDTETDRARRDDRAENNTRIAASEAVTPIG
jgi:YihY family inner membrane protein